MGTAKWLVWCYTHYFKPAFTVGDLSSPCPLPTARFWVWVSLYPAISKNLKAFLYGWLPLSNAYGISFRCSTIHNQTTTAFPSIATRHKICHPFGVPLMDVCLAGVPCFALHRLPVFFHAFGIILFEMPTALMSKIPTKTCRGKVVKEKLNYVKDDSSLFILHSSFCES